MIYTGVKPGGATVEVASPWLHTYKDIAKSIRQILKYYVALIDLDTVMYMHDTHPFLTFLLFHNEEF